MMRLRPSDVLILIAMAATSWAQACPPAPRVQGNYQGVAESLLFNGVPMQIERFDSKQAPEQVLAFFRSRWAGQGPAAPMEYPLGPWQVISAARTGCFYTVQIQGTGSGSTGLVAATDISQPASAKLAKPVPMMPNSSVINDIAHRDPGKTGRTVLLANGFSPQANADFYRRRMADEGWQSISDVQMKTPTGPGIAMVMKRDLAEVSLVITRKDQTTSVLANFMDNP